MKTGISEIIRSLDGIFHTRELRLFENNRDMEEVPDRFVNIKAMEANIKKNKDFDEIS